MRSRSRGALRSHLRGRLIVAFGSALPAADVATTRVLDTASALRWRIGPQFHDLLTEDLYTEAARIADRATQDGEAPRFDLDRTIDNLVTHRWLGCPIMLGMLTVVFWLTIAGANVPSGMLASVLIDKAHPWLHSIAAAIHTPSWLAGFLMDGVNLATAWVISVMLPPMAIYIPQLTLLEDFGYHSRESINLDGVPGLRPIGSRTVLARWNEDVRDLADLPTMIEVARRTGARYALVGSAVAIGGEVRFGADLYDACLG